MQTPLRVRAYSSKKPVEARPWPVIRLSEWLRVGFEDFFIAGGKDLAELEATLEEFWHRYRFVEDSMPENPRRTLPVMLHGDEGRGQVKRPLMVVSFQPLLSCYGGNHLNSKGLLGLNVSCVSGVAKRLMCLWYS